MNINTGDFNALTLNRGLERAATQGQGKKIGLHSNSKAGPAKAESIQSSNQVYYKKILEKLNAVLSKSGDKNIEQLNPSGFSPQAVADRILKFVEMGVNNIRNTEGDEAARNAFEKAKAGIEKGFNEATKILSNLGVFKGKVETNANETHGLLQDGMARLEEKLFSAEGGQKRLDVMA